MIEPNHAYFSLIGNHKHVWNVQNQKHFVPESPEPHDCASNRNDVIPIPTLSGYS